MPRKLTQEEFVERARRAHGDKYNYDEVRYINACTKVKIICPLHGSFWQIASDHLTGKGCRLCNGGCKKTKEQFIEEARKTHGNKYDYSLVDYIDKNTKVKIICPFHGVFLQSPDNHLRGKGKKGSGNGCPECAKTTTESFIKRAKEVHGDYDYSESRYLGSHTKLKIICPKHGEFWQTPGNHLSGCGCPFCSSSKGEKRIKEMLELNGFTLNEDFFTEQKFPETGKLAYDFYIPGKNLLIEYNGIQHYRPIKSFGGEKKLRLQRHHDWLKRKYARSHGIRLLTVPYTQFNIIEEILKEELCK